MNYLIELVILHDIVVNDEYALIKDYIPTPGSNIIDCGSHIGFYSVWASQNMEKEGKIIAIEPLSYNYKRLLFVVKMLGLTGVVIPVNVALLDRESFAKILRPWATVSSTLLESPLSASGQNWWSENVSCTTLDNLCRTLNLNKSRISLIKIDIEGAEGLVLKGAKETLKQTEKVIIEVHVNSVPVEDIVKTLHDIGFVVEGIFRIGRWQNVLVYARNKRM